MNEPGVSVQLVAAPSGCFLTPRKITSHHEVSYFSSLPPPILIPDKLRRQTRPGDPVTEFKYTSYTLVVTFAEKFDMIEGRQQLSQLTATVPHPWALLLSLGEL